MSKNKVTIVAHSSKFHTDDIFAVATLQLALENEFEIEVIRSRDMAVIEKADYVVDVGGIHDEAINRFDHHQKGGAGKRENEVPYAAFGLVWKKFGEELAGNAKVAQKIDQMIVQPIDANDNGMQFLETKIPGLYPFDTGLITYIFSPTWKESEGDIDAVFFTMVSYAKAFLSRAIVAISANVEAEAKVIEAYEKASDKRLIELEERYPWEEILGKFPEPLCVIYKNRDDNWSIKCVPKDFFSYESRKKLPETWAGKKDAELDEAAGVSGGVFCHNHRFMAVNKTREGILKMAEIALNS